MIKTCLPQNRPKLIAILSRKDSCLITPEPDLVLFLSLLFLGTIGKSTGLLCNKEVLALRRTSMLGLWRMDVSGFSIISSVSKGRKR